MKYVRDKQEKDKQVKMYGLVRIERSQIRLNVVSHFPILSQRESMLELTKQRHNKQTCARHILSIREPCQRYLAWGLALEWGILTATLLSNAQHVFLFVPVYCRYYYSITPCFQFSYMYCEYNHSGVLVIYVWRVFSSQRYNYNSFFFRIFI